MTRPRARRILRHVYEQSGFIRVKMDHRVGAVRTGWEIRLPSNDVVPADLIIAALHTLRLPAGSPYSKGRRWIVPVYGLETIERFLKVVRPSVKNAIPKLPRGTDLRFRDS